MIDVSPPRLRCDVLRRGLEPLKLTGDRFRKQVYRLDIAFLVADYIVQFSNSFVHRDRKIVSCLTPPIFELVAYDDLELDWPSYQDYVCLSTYRHLLICPYRK